MEFKYCFRIREIKLMQVVISAQTWEGKTRPTFRNIEGTQKMEE
jgi:hypothetical protein